jgi:flagellar biosynthesis/type III secretory pathway M-ring protein FliF/YscJ
MEAEIRSESTRTVKHHIGIAAVLLVYLVVSLLLFILQSNQTRAHDDLLERSRTNQERANLQFDRNRDFYRVIVENNLFRPLGWRAPKRESEYALIATWIESRGETAKALLMERRSKQTYYVALGERDGNATIENIESKQVNLNISGKIVILKVPSTQFLDSRKFCN